jgi:hypothetical protein
MGFLDELGNMIRSSPDEVSALGAKASANRARGSTDPQDVQGDRYAHFYDQGKQNGLLDLLVTQGIISPAYEFGVKPVIMASPTANDAFASIFGQEQAAGPNTSAPSLANVLAGAAGHARGYLDRLRGQ